MRITMKSHNGKHTVHCGNVTLSFASIHDALDFIDAQHECRDRDGMALNNQPSRLEFFRRVKA